MKEFVVFEENGDSSFFEYEKVEKKQTLKYARGGGWSHPGKDAYTLENTGNGLVFKDKLTKRVLKIDYCQADALRFLLELAYPNSNTFQGKLKKR